MSDNLDEALASFNQCVASDDCYARTAFLAAAVHALIEAINEFHPPISIVDSREGGRAMADWLDWQLKLSRRQRGGHEKPEAESDYDYWNGFVVALQLVRNSGALSALCQESG